MNKRSFNKLVEQYFVEQKELTDEEKDQMVYFIVRNRGPILAKLKTNNISDSWLNSMGYMHLTESPTTGELFIHTAEHMIK